MIGYAHWGRDRQCIKKQQYCDNNGKQLDSHNPGAPVRFFGIHLKTATDVSLLHLRVVTRFTNAMSHIFALGERVKYKEIRPAHEAGFYLRHNRTRHRTKDTIFGLETE